MSRITGHGLTTCDNPSVHQQMLDKHPQSSGIWPPHTRAQDNSDEIIIKGTAIIMDATDPEIGTGPRGLHANHVHCLNRSRNLDPTNTNSSLLIFEKLGARVVGNSCPWVSCALAGSLLTPIHKKATGFDARPVAAGDRDYATWVQAAQRELTSTIRDQVQPQQLAVGISSGVQTLSWGLKTILEYHNKNNLPLTIHKDDRINAHNSFDRKKSIEDIREAAANNPNLRNFARIADCVMRLQPQIYTRTTSNGIGITPLCKSEQGGQQGNALTNIIYPMTMDLPLKQTEALFDVTVRAIQDDTTIAGLAEKIYGTGNAREYLTSGFLERGNHPHPNKAQAYGNTPEQRALIPPDVEQPSFTIVNDYGVLETGWGIEVVGVPIGDDIFIKGWLNAKATELISKIKEISTKISNEDPHCANVLNNFSLQAQSEFIMSTNFPSQTIQFASKIDKAMESAYTLSLGSNLLSSTIMPNTHPEDPEFIKDRVLLRAKNGGAAIRPLHKREHYLNCANNVMHQLTNHTDSNNNFTPGLFPNLHSYLGNDWKTSSSQTAYEYIEQYQKGKNLHTLLINNIVTSQNNSFERPMSIYDEHPLIFGRGVKKLQKKDTG